MEISVKVNPMTSVVFNENLVPWFPRNMKRMKHLIFFLSTQIIIMWLWEGVQCFTMTASAFQAFLRPSHFEMVIKQLNIRRELPTVIDWNRTLNFSYYKLYIFLDIHLPFLQPDYFLKNQKEKGPLEDSCKKKSIDISQNRVFLL